MQLPKQDHYEVAIRQASESLRQADIEDRCYRSGAIFRPHEGRIEVTFAGRPVYITWPALNFVPPDGSTDSPPPETWEQILVLHYLQRATGTPPTGRWITFDHIPEGLFYLSAFRRRSVDRLVAAFGSQPERLSDAARSLGGAPAAHGDVGVTIPALPRVTLLFVLWRADDEIGPSGNVLFDSTISSYLPTEDVAVLAGMLIGKLARSLK